MFIYIKKETNDEITLISHYRNILSPSRPQYLTYNAAKTIKLVEENIKETSS